ncbi:hypothetical protein ROS1_43110 [Roseibium sp. ROS1]
MGFRSLRLASIAFPVLGSPILGSQILGSPVPDLRCAASGMTTGRAVVVAVSCKDSAGKNREACR